MKIDKGLQLAEELAISHPGNGGYYRLNYDLSRQIYPDVNYNISTDLITKDLNVIRKIEKIVINIVGIEEYVQCLKFITGAGKISDTTSVMYLLLKSSAEERCDACLLALKNDRKRSLRYEI